MTPTPNERSADALAEALRALSLARGNFVAAQDDLTLAMNRWDEDSKPTPFYVAVHAVRDNARTNAKLMDDAHKLIKAALTQHDAAKAEPASGAQCEDSELLDWLEGEGRPETYEDAPHSTVWWVVASDPGTTDLRDAIRAARAAQGEEGGT